MPFADMRYEGAPCRRHLLLLFIVIAVRRAMPPATRSAARYFASFLLFTLDHALSHAAFFFSPYFDMLSVIMLFFIFADAFAAAIPCYELSPYDT